ncbi:unnamed protein product [Lymnaea stagnalis]|uniref:Uncharacterized protein n=1 Tax=Lymnaea stagnalis TaxID=6523 RepID=A0AAV2HBR9_LYMST
MSSKVCSLKFLILVVCSTFEWRVCDAAVKNTRNDVTEMCPTPPKPVNGKVECSYSDALQLEIFCQFTCNSGYKLNNTDNIDIIYICDISTGFYDTVQPVHCIPTCNPPCLNGGQCVEGNKCVCSPPFYGEQCLHSPVTCMISVTPRFGSIDCTQDVSGGRVCIPRCLPTFTFETAVPEKYVCSKDGVWTPDISTVPDCIQDRCNASCLNGGVCTGPNTCSCTPPYSGDHCQTFALVTGVSSQNCPLPPSLVNGRIDCHYSNTSHNQILCQYNCTSGYMFEGTRAQTFDFSCDVSLGYYDPPLTPGCVPSCQPPCSNGGLCMKNNTCSCVPPYTGDRCSNQISIVG